uniref:Uncharacterized protein n=1 Tax=uncultured marine group II/III euryarchaeote KM3_51_D01 TaxID=1456454 RepID=A0A075H5A3_9EURY|nr:hypothetical protein [uncultured marine group II/III euryarchaeote KM3_51_D01]
MEKLVMKVSKIAGSSLVGLIVLCNAAYAITAPNTSAVPDEILQPFWNAYALIKGIATAAVALALAYNFMQWSAASGNPAEREQIKKQMLAVILGYAGILLAVPIINYLV